MIPYMVGKLAPNSTHFIKAFASRRPLPPDALLSAAGHENRSQRKLFLSGGGLDGGGGSVWHGKERV